MAGGIVMTLVLVGLSKAAGWGDETALYWGEFTSLLFFRLSWFAKGWQITRLWRVTHLPPWSEQRAGRGR